MSITSVPWACPDFGEAEKEAIRRVVDSGWMTMGKETAKLENELAKVTGKKYNIVYNSGTSSIVASLLAIGAYHEGYTARIPSYTYKATENAVYASGIRDIKYGTVNPSTGIMSPKMSEYKHEVQIPVHFAGLPINQQVWSETPKVVEDAAESFGATTSYTGDVYSDRVVCYSFHAAKVITMIEGGCVSTDNHSLAYRLKAVRCHGEDPEHKGVFITRGLNMKPLDICSAVGRVQLSKLPKYLRNRDRISSLYRSELDGLVGFQYIPDYVKKHANMMFPIYVKKPIELGEHLAKNHIGYRLGWKPFNDSLGAKFIYEHIICIPMYNTLTEDEALYVIDKIKEKV